MTSESAIASVGLEALDWVVLAGYLAAMVALGASFYKGQKTTRDFFLAGRSMSWMPVGLSLIGGTVPDRHPLQRASIVIGNKLVNSFAGPMFSIFLFGMLTRRARPLGVCVGAVAGMAVMAWMIFATDVNFLWPSTFGLIVSLGVGYGWSLAGRPLVREKLRWTLREQRRLWKQER